MTTRFPRSLPSPPPLQAAIYARVSSDQQAERHTIDSQISDLKAHAAEDGHAVPDEYLFMRILKNRWQRHGVDRRGNLTQGDSLSLRIVSRWRHDDPSGVA